MSQTAKEDMKFTPETEKTKPTRARAPRAKTVSEGRRRRADNNDQSGYMNLALDEAKLDKSAYHYRWAKNDPQRLNRLTVQDDYDVVSDTSQDTSGAGTAIERGAGDGGMILLRKPREYYEEDRRAKEASRKKLESQIKSGQQDRESMGADGGSHYVPDGGISIK